MSLIWVASCDKWAWSLWSLSKDTASQRWHFSQKQLEPALIYLSIVHNTKKSFLPNFYPWGHSLDKFPCPTRARMLGGRRERGFILCFNPVNLNRIYFQWHIHTFFWELMLAPCAISSLHTSTCPSWAAMYRGEAPFCREDSTTNTLISLLTGVDCYRCLVLD